MMKLNRICFDGDGHHNGVMESQTDFSCVALGNANILVFKPLFQGGWMMWYNLGPFQDLDAFIKSRLIRAHTFVCLPFYFIFSSREMALQKVLNYCPHTYTAKQIQVAGRSGGNWKSWAPCFSAHLTRECAKAILTDMLSLQIYNKTVSVLPYFYPIKLKHKTLPT